MIEDDDCLRYDAPGFLLLLGTKLFARCAEQRLTALGIGYADVSVILQLRRDGPSLQRDLLRAAAVGQPAMVAIIARMEQAGLVDRRDHETDRRARLIALTREGERIAARVAEILEEVNARALDGFSAEDCASVVRLLRRLNANMGGLAG